MKNQNKKEASQQEQSAQDLAERSSVRSFDATAKAESGEGQNKARTDGKNSEKKKKLITSILRIAALFVVIAITIYIITIRTRVGEFAAYGYPGIFVIAMLANATVLLPAPGVAVIYAMGSIFNPFGVALAAGTGAAVGELSGYLAGFSGQAVIERGDVYDRIHPWVVKYGGWAILVLSAIPNPFFDIAGIAAGMVKMPIRTFLIFTWIGQMIKMLLFALAGRYSIGWIATFFE